MEDDPEVNSCHLPSGDEGEFSQLLTQKEEILKEEPLLTERSLICDMAHVIQQARKLEKHTFEYQLGGHFMFKNLISHGLHVKFYCICSNTLCKKKRLLLLIQRGIC